MIECLTASILEAWKTSGKVVKAVYTAVRGVTLTDVAYAKGTALQEGISKGGEKRDLLCNFKRQKKRTRKATRQ